MQELEQIDVVHNEQAGRFEAQVGGGRAELRYRRVDDCLIFSYTGVPAAQRRRGIGGQLVRAGLEFARQEGLRVEPRCSFVANYIREHPEYQALVV